MAQQTLVPFGKYKGQPVESLAQDREYCEWLTGQEWFRTRYTTIHTLIVNNFAEPHETPEHNALQALFTNQAWVTAFVSAYLGRTWWSDVLRRHLAKTHALCSKGLALYDARLKHFEGKHHLESWEASELTRWRTDAEHLRANYQRRVAWLQSGLVPRVQIETLTFENRGTDVEFHYVVGVENDEVCFGITLLTSAGYNDYEQLRSPQTGGKVRVECKPTLGDDYPGVLRQMIAHESNVLLLGRGGYQGVGATYEQVQQILGASSIKVVSIADVDAALNKSPAL